MAPPNRDALSKLGKRVKSLPTLLVRLLETSDGWSSTRGTLVDSAEDILDTLDGQPALASFCAETSLVPIVNLRDGRRWLCNDCKEGVVLMVDCTQAVADWTVVADSLAALVLSHVDAIESGRYDKDTSLTITGLLPAVPLGTGRPSRCDVISSLLRNPIALRLASHRSWKHETFGDVHRVAASGQTDDLSDMIAANLWCIDQKTTHGATPLHVACAYAVPSCVSVLLDAGAEVNVKDSSSSSALHALCRGPTAAGPTAAPAPPSPDASKSNRISILSSLARAGADVNCVNDDGQTPLHVAVFGGSQPGLVRALCSLGADVSSRDSSGRSMLHLACLSVTAHTPDTVRFLLGNGAYAGVRDEERYTPLHYLFRSYGADTHDALRTTVKLLLAAGANPNAIGGLVEETPLHAAAAVHAIDLLISAGGDKNRTDRYGRRPAHHHVHVPAAPSPSPSPSPTTTAAGPAPGGGGGGGGGGSSKVK